MDSNGKVDVTTICGTAPGGLGNSYGITTYGLRPVVLMPKDTKITSGSGSSSDPYVIETETPFVKYNNQIWRILYNDSTHGLQLISDDNVDTVTLGGPNLSSTVKAYNNAVSILNSEAQNYKGTKAIDTRSVGSKATLNEDGMFDKESLILNVDYPLKYSDENYLEDLEKIVSLGLNASDTTWLASRDYHLNGKQNYHNYDVRVVLIDGTLNAYNLLDDTSGLDENSWNSGTYGFRPVILMPSDVKITSGSGISADPYIIE